MIHWWHGPGVLLDYTNPQAVQWWHKQMAPILALGLDGWKVDGTDPYIMELIEPRYVCELRWCLPLSEWID